MADVRARRKALRGERRVVELTFDASTSLDPDDARQEDEKKTTFVKFCLDHLKKHLKKSSNPRTDEALHILAAAIHPNEEHRCLRRDARQVFDVLDSELTSDEWAKFLGFTLELAAAKGDKELGARLLKAEAALASAVHAAARSGHGAMMDFLLENGGSTGDRDSREETPLHAAARAGRLETARSLLLRGADKNAVSNAGGTALYWAARRNNVAVVAELLAAGADLTIRYAEGDLSPLDAAAGFGHTDVMRVLIEHRVDANAVGAEGRTALYWSVYAGKAKAVDLLAEAGADVNARNSAGEFVGCAPLHLALHWCERDAARALLRNGADVNARDGDGKTPLHYAAERARYGMVRVVDLLLRMGADETVASEQGLTPIDLLGPMDLARNVERARWLLTNAEGDRAWRRRGYLAMCRAHPERLRRKQPSGHRCGGIARRTRSRAKKQRQVRVPAEATLEAVPWMRESRASGAA